MTKLERVIEEITKTKAKIAEGNTRLRELEKQKIVYEDEELAKVARKNNLSANTLEAMLVTYKSHEPQAQNPQPQPPEKAKTPPKEEFVDDEE